MEETFGRVCTLFGENQKTRDPSEFFKAFVDFIGLYKVCIKGKPHLLLSAADTLAFIYEKYNSSQISVGSGA